MEKAVNTSAAAGATLLSLLTSLGAVSAASCCALPLALSLAGVGGAWLGGLTELSFYRTYVLAAAAGALALGWGVAMWRRRAICMAGGACVQPERVWLTFGTLGLSTLLVVVAAAWSWLEPALMAGLLRPVAATT